MDKERCRKAEALWRNHIKQLFGGKCFMHHSRYIPRNGDHAHHLLSRRYRWAAFHPLNGVYLCWECHGKVHRKGDKELRSLLDLRFPEWTDALETLHRTVKAKSEPFNQAALDNAIEELEKVKWED